MDCPRCKAKNAMQRVYGAIGSSMHWDDPGVQYGTTSGGLCYNCGHWIEPPVRIEKPMPQQDSSVVVMRPKSDHRTKASEELRAKLAPHLDMCKGLREARCAWRDIADVLAEKKKVIVSYSTLRDWFYTQTNLPRTIARKRAA